MESQHPIKLLVVGGDVAGNGEVTRLKCLAAELGIEDMTEFVGTVDHQLLPLYYNAADVCVVPSYYESFGLVALEALACGTPRGGLPGGWTALGGATRADRVSDVSEVPGGLRRLLGNDPLQQGTADKYEEIGPEAGRGPGVEDGSRRDPPAV